jgi:hypothetical protein
MGDSNYPLKRNSTQTVLLMDLGILGFMGMNCASSMMKCTLTDHLRKLHLSSNQQIVEPVWKKVDSIDTHC